VGQPEFDILGIGTTAVDDFLHVNDFPPPDEKRPVLKKARQLGGLVATALAAAGHLGARCAYAGVLGDDELSAAVRNGLDSVGIDRRHLMIQEGAGPAHSVIVVGQRDSTRNIFFDIAPMRPLPVEQIAPELIGLAKVLFIDQFGVEGKIRAAEHARDLGIPVVADMEWADLAGTDQLAALVGHLIMPWHFASEITGEHDPVRALEQVHRRCRRPCTAVTCGIQGCYYLTVESLREVQYQPAFSVEAVETTGCGDVFHGAYAAALAAGCDVRTCIRQAAAAAAVYASRPSGWSHLPTAADADALLSNVRG
jgi:sulfofructose kinase